MALMSVAEALARVLDGAAALPAEPAPLTEAAGRVLAADVAALRTQPPEDLSAMDGYAARAEDVAKVPATRKVIGEVAAGHPFGASIGPGQAARIFTGGVVPPGADTIVIQENTKAEGDRVTVTTPAAKGRHIRRAGLDFTKGQMLLPRGHLLSDCDLMLAAAMNHQPCRCIAVLGGGARHWRRASRWPDACPGETTYSNGFALMALARGR